MLHAPSSDQKSKSADSQHATTRATPTNQQEIAPAQAQPHIQGNRALLRQLQRKAVPGTLTVNTPGDVYEQEADRVADQVMRMPSPAAPSLQRKCACGGNAGSDGECAACKAKRLGLQRQAAAPHTPTQAPPSVHQTLSSPGQPLSAETRAFMEPRFGQDFSAVRVHTDSQAAQSAQDVSALAYTVGRNVVFGEGQYMPGTSNGQKLIAHELTHVVQQSRESDSNFESKVTCNPNLHKRLTLHSVQKLPLSASMLQRACRLTGWEHEYDGCSVPALLVFLIGTSDKDNPALGRDTQFANPQHNGPCDHHDRCYQTCNQSPEGRAACDRQMYEEMMAVCRASAETPDIRGRCFHFAGTYYMGLRAGGGSAWNTRQAQVCACHPAGDFPTPPRDETTG